MKKSVEQKLKERIIEVFDNFEDDHADFGWQELRTKYPAKRTNKAVIWWRSAAAVLILCGLGYLFTTTQEPAGLSAQKTRPPLEKFDPSENTSNAGSISPEEDNPVAAPEPVAPAGLKESATTKSPYSSPFIASRSKAHQEDTRTETITEDILPETTGTTMSDNQNTLPSSVLESESALPAVAMTAEPDPSANGSAINNEHPKADVLSAATVRPHVTAEEKQKKSESSVEKKLALAFYAGTFMNYAEGSDNTINIGAGISTGIALSKHFTLSTGVAIARNTLMFNDKLPRSSSASFMGNIQAQLAPGSTGKFAVIPSISRLDAELLNLDIPVAIRYDINPKTRNFFISGGLTSSSYLSETYTYSYNNFNLASNAFGAAEDEKMEMSLSKFDFARTLNVSVGMTYPLGEKQNLTVEPFLKYPLGGLGSQNIVFGAAGINLKIQMKHNNKR